MGKKYRHIFFDLDRTLWDFRKNSAETLLEMIGKFSLQKIISDSNEFIEKYNYYNDRLWDYYRLRRIKKLQLRDERFRLLLKDYGITDRKLIQELSRYYLNVSPAKTALVPGALELLEYLSKDYSLYILSNGFYDVQLTKMINSGISRYFKKLFTSDRIGYAKPDTHMFDYAVKSVNARKEESLMVGDNELIDIEGARNAHIDQVLFNPEGKFTTIPATIEIRNLQELKRWL
jgi:putative hydrolase of the HAD superfamily